MSPEASTSPHEYKTHNRIEISRSSVLHNVELFKKISGLSVIPVLKGNAYGHGIDQMAQILLSTDLTYIAVNSYAEALRVRAVSEQPVLIMGMIAPENFAHITYDNFAFVIHDCTTIKALAKTGRTINVHIECNSGMNRYGATHSELDDILDELQKAPNLILEGVMSHLADSDGTDQKTVDQAVEIFDCFVEKVHENGFTPKILHIAQTAGSCKSASRYATAIRLGIGLYGINPFAPNHPKHVELSDIKPVLQLISTITKTRKLTAGEGVSYNYTYTASNDMTIGILPIGYHEGVPRELSNRGIVQYNKKYVNIIGRVCMNHIMIDLTNTAATVGDEITIISCNAHDRNALDRIAAKNNLFNYSMMTSLSPDIRRIIVK